MNNVNLLAIRINSLFRDFVQLHKYVDVDNFGLRFSESISPMLIENSPVNIAASAAIDSTETQFFLANRIGRRRFLEAFGPIIPTTLPARSLVEYLADFKKHAERVLARKLRSDGNEESLRSSLQTFLAGHYLTYREAESGLGRIDILIVEPWRELIETKLWDGEQNFEDGLEELAAYLGTEGLPRGHYVNLEFGQAADFLEKKGSDSWQTRLNNKTINVLFIRVPLDPPSQLAKARRRRAKT